MTSLNFVLACVAIVFVPSGQEIGQLYKPTLELAKANYNFSEPAPSPPDLPESNRSVLSSGAISTVSTVSAALSAATNRTQRSVSATAADDTKPRDISPANATRIWDNLQARGCCGLENSTDWQPHVPKSCCAAPQKDENNLTFCKQSDDYHKQGCLSLIGSTSMNLQIVLALIALVSFYLAIVSGISAYKTYSYSEASQNAYT